MSPPDTDLEKQEKRHRPSLRGIAIAVAAVLVVILGITLLGPNEVTEEAAPGTEATSD